MPKITCSLKDLQKLLRRTFSEEKLHDLLPYAKAELEQVNNDELTISFADTNLPHLWSVEGLARHLRGVLGVETGIAKLPLEKQSFSVLVDKSVASVRPAIATFVAKGPALTEELLLQLIQLQEKLTEHYGRKRQKVSIGLYPSAKIQFPVTYKAVEPRNVRFIPLEGKYEQTLQQIITTHPKGIAYGWILANAKKYPILVDARNQVLSLAPIINSATTGKLQLGDTELFFDATGMDIVGVQLVATIVAFALADRGYKIYPCNVKYGKNTVRCPVVEPQKIKFDEMLPQKLLGVPLHGAQIKALLKKARADYQSPFALVPAYRNDIMHPVDIIEDIAIMHGYETMTALPLTTATIGTPLPAVGFANAVRELLVGLGYQECLSTILSNKDVLYEKTKLQDTGTIEIANPVSATYAVVRTWLVPVLLELLGKNKHAEYPQRVFEHGLVTVRKNNEVCDYERVAALASHAHADYTEAKQALEYVLRMLGAQYTFEETEHASFIPGRVARVAVNGVKVAYVGELHPEVLQKFSIEQPVAGFELNLSDLRQVLGKH